MYIDAAINERESMLPGVGTTIRDSWGVTLAANEKPLKGYFSANKKNYRTTTGLFGKNTIQFAEDIAGFGLVVQNTEDESMAANGI